MVEKVEMVMRVVAKLREKWRCSRSNDRGEGDGRGSDGGGSEVMGKVEIQLVVMKREMKWPWMWG